MAIKIKKNGKIEQFTLHSTDVKVLDLEGKFKKKDLESVIREISDTEHIHIGEVDTTKDGVWIDDGEILDNADDNGVVKRLKTFVNEAIGELSSLTTSIKGNLVGAINEIKGNVDQLSGTNLLINGDFQVWQRGTSFSNIAINNWIYTADRWRVLSQKAGVNVSKITNGISISSPNTAGLIALSHAYEVPSYLLGKTVTVSFDIKSSVNYESTFYAFNGNNYTSIIYSKNHTVTTEKQRFQFTFTLPLTMTDNILHFWIGRAENIGVTVEISNVKLELGSQATTFVPRSFGEELALCQRYYEVSDEDEPIFGYSNNIESMCTWKYKATKRVRPTISLSHFQFGAERLWVNSTDGTLVNAQCSPYIININHCRIKLDNATDRQTLGNKYITMCGKFIADSEIY